jgi:hypothetical protein
VHFTFFTPNSGKISCICYLPNFLNEIYYRAVLNVRIVQEIRPGVGRTPKGNKKREVQQVVPGEKL